jgi:hypothetical protein
MVNFERTTTRMEETSAQKPLSKEEILAEFANTTFDARFADFFYDRYLDEFEVWEDYDNPNEMALKCVKHGLTWYALYKQIGHHEQWCKAAYEFGCEGVQIVVSLENEIECMAEVTERVESHSKDLFISTKDSEYAKHFEHIKKHYQKDGIFMLFYSEYAKEFGFDRDMLDIVSRKTRAYTDAIERKKNEDFASYYATLVDYNSEQAWELAELRERLKKEGKDELYVDVCLRKTAELVDEYGSEIPEHKSKEVKAYMKAWDITRGSDFQESLLEEKKRFIGIYINVYMNAFYPENPKAIPWDRFDDFVLDIAKRQFKGENVDVEPRTLDTLLNAMMQNKAKGGV